MNSTALALAALLGLVVLARPGASGARGRNESGSPLDPSAYAAERVALLRSRLADLALRAAVERFAPSLLGAVPVEAVVGLSASSAGLREGAPPSREPVVGWLPLRRASLASLALDAAARRAFGREIPTAPVGRASPWYDDAAAQTFAGCWDLRRHLDAVNARLDAPERAELGTVWALALATGAYSVGAGVLVPLVRGAHLGGVPQGERLAALGAYVARTCRARSGRVEGVACGGYWHAAHAVLRVAQRVECGRALAGAEGSQWFGRAVEPADVSRLVALV